MSDLPLTPRTVSPEHLSAAQDVIKSLSAVADMQSLGLKAPPFTRARGLYEQLLHSLRNLLHFEGGHLMITWHNDQLNINQISLPDNEANVEALETLEVVFASRQIEGMVFRFLPDQEQLKYFFRRLQTLDAQAVSHLGKPGSLVTLPDERDLIGLQLLLSSSPLILNELPDPNNSGMGVRTAFDTVVKESSLQWVGYASPKDYPQGQHLNEGQVQKFCLGVYANLISTTLRFVRMAREVHKRESSLPFLALHRMVHQVSRAYQASPSLLTACALLGARDPSPSRRLAHSVLFAVGLARFHGLSAPLIAEVGLTAFIHGLRERYGFFGLSSELREMEIMRLLMGEQALTSLKVRSIYAAALVGMPRTWSSSAGASPEPPTSSKLVAVAADFAEILDGGHGDRKEAPLPPWTALDKLQKHHSKHAKDLVYEHAELVAMARWLGPMPPGTVVVLKEGETAVILPSEGRQVLARVLLDAQQKPVDLKKDPVLLGRRPSARFAPTPLKIKHILSARPVIARAGRALFSEAASLWMDIVMPSKHNPQADASVTSS